MSGETIETLNLYELPVTAAPHRVVSLVPSVTESFFDLGLGEVVVGVTDYCVYPAAALQSRVPVGGTKNPRIDDILALEPELVIANQEENTPEVVEALCARGVAVWLTFPRTVREALDLLWTIGRLYQSKIAAARLELLERAVEWASAAVPETRLRYFCPIWYQSDERSEDWWMTFNRLTYAHDLLQRCGGDNIFAQRERQVPLAADLGRAAARPTPDRDTRYPRVTLSEVRAADPDVILLPDEPYRFDDSVRRLVEEELRDSTAVRTGRIHLVDGSLITWHGTRLGRALQELPAFFSL